MNIQNKAISSMTGDSAEIRYQKALKEITKLIGVNNEIKQEMGRAQEAIAEYQEGLRDRNSQIEELLNNLEELEKQKYSLTHRCMDLQQQNISLVEELTQLQAKSANQHQQLHKNPPYQQAPRTESRSGSRGKDNGVEYRKIIDELQGTIQKKNEIIKQLSSRNEEGARKNTVDPYDRVTTLNDLISKNQKIVNNEELFKKLQDSKLYIETLSKEIADLKSKLMRSENNHSLLKIASEKTYKNIYENNMYEKVLSPRNLSSHRNEEAEIYKRHKKLQSQFNKISGKYDEMKKKFDAMKDKLEQGTRFRNSANAKLSKYEQLIQKQQNQIQQLLVNHEKQINDMTENFSSRINEQRLSFNPTKNAKAMKMMESLQNQNKSLKKKFQLCSIELTKCFKTLESYRSKLSQIEAEYNQIAIQKQQLIQKLSRMQNGGREKSVYTKGSDRKLMVNGQESIDIS